MNTANDGGFSHLPTTEVSDDIFHSHSTRFIGFYKKCVQKINQYTFLLFLQQLAIHRMLLILFVYVQRNSILPLKGQ